VLRHLQREGDVVAHAHVRIERVGLEHHRQPALRRADVADVEAVDQNGAGGEVLEAGDQPQQRRLAAARRPDEHGEFAVLDLEIDAVDDAHGAEALAHAFQFDAAHGRVSLDPDHLTAPKVRPRTNCFCENHREP
jgi:hypothetical protein